MSQLGSLITQNDEPMFTEDQIQEITSIIPTDDQTPNFVNNLISLISMYNYDRAIDLLKKESNLDQFMFNTLLFEQPKSIINDMYIKTLKQPRFITGFYKCPECHSSNVRTRTLQTRSGDESSTDFNTCMGCGKKWSIN